MHEMGVAAEIVRIAIENAQQAGAKQVVAVKLRIGEWSGVDIQSLRFALETIRDGTPLDGCHFELESVAPEFRCGTCRQLYVAEGYHSACTYCGSRNGRLERGDELTLAELEVEEM